jgi:hypothetical protein
MNRIAYPILLSFLLSTGALAQEGGMIKEISVKMDLAAIVNPEAAKRYGNLASDLQGAIAALLADRIGEEGREVKVDISEAELSNAFTGPAGLEESKLVGMVYITDENDNSNFNIYELTVTVEQARLFFPPETDETTLTASSEAYYASLVSAFARAVADRIDN